MDKWDKFVERIIKASQADEPQAAAAAVGGMLAEFCRTVELLSEDLDRLATAAEKANAPFEITGDPAKIELPQAE